MKSAVIFISLILVGCATTQNKGTIQPFSTRAYNTWFIETDPKTHESRPIFCMANLKDGIPAPKCFKSERVE